MPEAANIAFVITSYRNTGPMNQTYYLVKGLKKYGFNISILSIFNEIKGDSVKEKFDLIGVRQVCLGLNKKRSLFLARARVKAALTSLSPDVVHAVGMPPYEMTLGYHAAIPFTVIRNYCREDYPAKYGAVLGMFMAIRDISLIRKQLNKGFPLAVCSESLSEIYFEKEGISLPVIANGVDTGLYCPNQLEREATRKELGISDSSFVVVYSGQFNKRKDQSFAIETFLAATAKQNVKLVLLGDGPLLQPLQNRYKNLESIIFTGRVSNVQKYLNAADLYYSTSRSEGMPNGVLEAMACGLPAVLSDIPQHREVIKGVDDDLCQTYRLGDAESAVKILSKSIHNLHTGTCDQIRDLVVRKYSSSTMVDNYANFYYSLIQAKECGCRNGKGA